MAIEVTITANGIEVIDSEKAGGPVTVRMPDTTLLVEGTTASVLNKSLAGTTGVTFQSNAGSSADELINPTSRGSAPASTTGSIVVTRAYIQWILIKTGHVNPTWYVQHYEAQ